MRETLITAAGRSGTTRVLSEQVVASYRSRQRSRRALLERVRPPAAPAGSRDGVR